MHYASNTLNISSTDRENIHKVAHIRHERPQRRPSDSTEHIRCPGEYTLHDRSLIKMFIHTITHVVDTGVDWSFMLGEDAEEEGSELVCCHIGSRVTKKLTFSTSLFITYFNRNIRPKDNKNKKA